MIKCAIFTALIAVGAFIKIPVPLVPFTLQTLFTSLAGLILGGPLGALSAAMYVFLGLIGIPIFASGGGIGYVFVPSFGYIIGFIIEAYVVGKITYRGGEPSFKRMLFASLIGLLIVYATGMLYYYLMGNLVIGKPIGVWSLFVYCCFMFIPGDVVSCVLASYLANRLKGKINKN